MKAPETPPIAARRDHMAETSSREADTPGMAEARALAARLQKAAEEGRVDNDIFAENAVIWHNSDELTLTMAENMSHVLMFASKVPKWRYEDVRVTPFNGGYVQQHRWVGETVTGEEFSLSACAVVRIRDGRIVRIDEYFDSAPIARLGVDAWAPKKSAALK